MWEELLHQLPMRRGHFQRESGQHGDRWLDLNSVLVRPTKLRPFAGELARRLSQYEIDAVCGPLIGGAFLAQLIAEELDLPFFYAERSTHSRAAGHFLVRYQIPLALREKARGKSVALVDDAINAGSAVRLTLADLRACGARTTAIGALLVLGSSAAELATREHVPLESVAFLPNTVWPPADCPLCGAGVALENDVA